MAMIAPKERSPFPTQLGKYTIVERIASGGMATVFVARQRGVAGFERIVALKACHEHLRDNDAFAAMFLDEARLAARIRHPNVVATLDVNDGIPMYLVMEYVEGGSLSSLVRAARRRGARLPVAVSLRIVMDMLAGLQATHDCRGPDGRALGLVHCDVSPQNVLVGFDGTARITDFGIARALAFAREDDGLIKGKMTYLAPEQLVAGGSFTQRVDVFSAGVVLWELLAGERLFRESRAGCQVVPPSAVDARLAMFDAIVMRALAHDPSRRFASAVDFLSALEALPLRPATARVVGDDVRRYFGSGVRRAQVPPRTSFAPSAIVKVNRADCAREIPTQVLAPTPALLAAVTDPPAPPQEPAPATTMRTRRIVVAVALLLLGCAGGLLAATQPSDAAKVVQPPP
jgi:eukaryotic-like serine/threonine-protein kinase